MWDVGSYALGAPNMLLSAERDGKALALANRYASEGLRVLCLAFSHIPLKEDNRLPAQLRCIALLLLSDKLREDAAETFQYFAAEGVTLKVISGDNPRTVSAVAARAGLGNAEKAFDMRLAAEDEDYAALTEEYTVFGHVTPQQKQALIRGLQENGHTACMTGDGVNDILAMREADCSVAMVGGSDAARSACDFVLLSDNFKSMVSVLQEGRRVINNIERVSSLYMVKTVYSVLLALIYVFIPAPYPFSPLQLTPVSLFTVGIPSFLLALQANYSKPANRLAANIVEHSVPAALTIVFNTLYLQLASLLFKLPMAESSTMVVFLLGAVGFYLLLVIMKPYDTRPRRSCCRSSPRGSWHPSCSSVISSRWKACSTAAPSSTCRYSISAITSTASSGRPTAKPWTGCGKHGVNGYDRRTSIKRNRLTHTGIPKLQCEEKNHVRPSPD